MKRKICSILAIVLIISVIAGCSNSDTKNDKQNKEKTNNQTNSGEVIVSASGESQKAAKRIITDLMGREVEIPSEVKSIVCTGAGALRMVCYAQAADLVIGVEDNDKKPTIKRAYNYVYNDSFKELPSIGKGGGRGYTAYEEEIINLQPDLILSSYTGDALEQLADKTGIPVVSVTYQSDMFDPDFQKSLTLIGDILGRQERCAEVLSYISDAKKDLNERTKNIPDKDKPTAYTGAVTFSGGHGFGGTYGRFSPFTAINAINVADETGETGSFEVDWEKVVDWDPDYIFLDPGNMDLVNEEYNKNPDYFKSLRAVREGRVYSMISYNNYTTNIELAIADAYYAGSVLFPEHFSDIDIAQKTDELLEKFLGRRFYSEMEAAGLKFGEITIGE